MASPSFNFGLVERIRQLQIQLRGHEGNARGRNLAGLDTLGGYTRQSRFQLDPLAFSDAILVKQILFHLLWLQWLVMSSLKQF